MTVRRSHEQCQKATLRATKRRYGPDDHCAACGIIREQLPAGPGEPADNGVCCAACLAEFPELLRMCPDEVVVWHWQRYGKVLGAGHNADNARAAEAWLRIQARQGRTDDGMAFVAAVAFGVKDTALLVRYVRSLNERARVEQVAVP